MYWRSSEKQYCEKIRIKVRVLVSPPFYSSIVQWLEHSVDNRKTVVQLHVELPFIIYGANNLTVKVSVCDAENTGSIPVWHPILVRWQSQVDCVPLLREWTLKKVPWVQIPLLPPFFSGLAEFGLLR